MAHIESVHLKVRRYKCVTCTFSSYKKHDMQRHLIKHKEHVGTLVAKKPSTTLAEMEMALEELSYNPYNGKSKFY